MFAEAASVLCKLLAVDVTHAPMDGAQNVLVRRCEYRCVDNSREHHQIYYYDRCPRYIWKNTKSLYRRS